MRVGETKFKTIASYFFVLIIFTLALISFTKQSFALSCMPTCSSVDGRFITIVEGAAFETLAGSTLNVRLTVSGNINSFTFGIFDGDSDPSNGNWDNGAGDSLFTYTLTADPDRDNIGPEVFSVSTTTLPNNDWADFTIINDPQALGADGLYRYTVTIQHLEETEIQNSFKLRSDLGLLEIDEPFQFIDNLASLNDVAIVYPNFVAPPSIEDKVGSNYDGSFTFTYIIPNNVGTLTEIAHWDGDADHGQSDGTDPQDTDDANTPNTIPVFSPADAVDTEPEGINLSAPNDNTTPILRVYGEAVTYSVTIPGVGTFHNPNPSGNKEWEQFVLSTTTNDPSIADAMVSEIPLSGTYIIKIEGLDMVNLMALNPPFPMRGEFDFEPIPRAGVPTLSEWGLVTMVLGFGLIAFFVVRKRNLVRS